MLRSRLRFGCVLLTTLVSKFVSVTYCSKMCMNLFRCSTYVTLAYCWSGPTPTIGQLTGLLCNYVLDTLRQYLSRSSLSWTRIVPICQPGRLVNPTTIRPRWWHMLVFVKSQSLRPPFLLTMATVQTEDDIVTYRPHQTASASTTLGLDTATH